MSETATPISLDDAFGQVAPHRECCDCCEDCCPFDEAEEWQGTLWAFTAADGTEYLTDRYVMLRRDLLDADDLKTTLNVPVVDWAVVPTEQPPASDAQRGVYVLDFCDRFGVTRHVHEKSNIVHLYQGADHIGWTTVSVKGPWADVADLPAIREIAAACRIDLGRAFAAYHLALGVPS